MYSTDKYPHTISDKKFEGCRPANSEEKILLNQARKEFNALNPGTQYHTIMDGKNEYQVRGLGNLKVEMTHIHTV